MSRFGQKAVTLEEDLCMPGLNCILVCQDIGKKGRCLYITAVPARVFDEIYCHPALRGEGIDALTAGRSINCRLYRRHREGVRPRGSPPCYLQVYQCAAVTEFIDADKLFSHCRKRGHPR